MAVYQNPEETARKVLSMLRKYNVMYPEQLAAFFYGEETSVLRAIRRLEKKRQLYLNPYTGLLASSENAYSLKDDGTILSLWVLADLCRRRPVEYHFLAEHTGQRLYPPLKAHRHAAGTHLNHFLHPAAQGPSLLPHNGTAHRRNPAFHHSHRSFHRRRLRSWLWTICGRHADRRR